MDISGIRRSSNAEEGAKRFFQTSNLIVGHFKREADKQNIYKLTTNTNTLTNLLIGSSAIHLFHYLGIRTKSSEDELTSVDNTDAFENAQKKELFNEFAQFLENSIQYAIELSNFTITYEKQILDAMVAQKNVTDEEFVTGLKDQIEQNLIQVLNKYPIVIFYDHVGELTGLTAYVKQQILKEAAGLKVTSLDLEKDMVKESHDDKYIELSTLNRLVTKMQETFEFGSVKDLKMETFPIRKMINAVLNYRLNIYPVSIRALEAYRKATDLKSEIYNRFLAANQKPVDFTTFETEIIQFIIKAIQDQAKLGSYPLVYLLENLLEMNFQDTFDLLNRYGISDINAFTEVQSWNMESFNRDIQMFSITKMDVMQLNKFENELQAVEFKLNEMKKRNFCVTERSVKEILQVQKVHELNYVKEACEGAGVDYDRLTNLYKKEQLLNTIFKKKYPYKWYSTLILFFDLAEIHQNLARFIYFNIFAKICNQVARILETYVKMKEDKGLFLLGLKRIYESGEQEKWVMVKIEELMIERIMNRQRELSIVFNAENQAFIVNGFILTRLMEINYQAGLKQLTTEPSTLYEDIKELDLPQDMISPVSYTIALDLINRFKEFQDIKQTKKEQILEAKEEKATAQAVDIKKAQESSTLNWIEKKITASMMSVRTNINPTALYWSEKDLKVAIDNLKMHSELKDRKLCTQCGLDTTTAECPIHHATAIRVATPADLFAQFYMFALDRLKGMWSKLKIPPYAEVYDEVKQLFIANMNRRLRRDPTESDYIKIIEGERVDIAKTIAKSIGEFLDKALYKKFKDSISTPNP